MVIEIKIQLDDNGEATVLQAAANPDARFQSKRLLAAAYVAPQVSTGAIQAAHAGGSQPIGGIGTGDSPSAARKGRSQPIDGIGTGGSSLRSMQGAPVVVVGPIIVCGPGTPHYSQAANANHEVRTVEPKRAAARRA